MVDEETILYLSSTAMLALLILFTASNNGLLGLLIIVFSLLAIGMILCINYVDFLIFPAFTKLFRIKLVPANGYTISDGQEAVVKVSGGVYYATGYLTGNIYGYVFTSEVPEESDKDFSGAVDRWERTAMNIDFPFKFNVMTMPEDVQVYRDELDGQRGYVEFQMSREAASTKPNDMTMQEFQRKLQILQEKMDRVSQGERPLNVIMYIESTAVGVSEKEALDTLTLQLTELQTLFNAFDLSIFRVTGREVHFLHEFDYKIPTEAELRKTFQTQK